MKELHFDLKAGATAPAAGKPSAEDAEEARSARSKSQNDVQGRGRCHKRGHLDEAIAKFNEVLVDLPNCVDCYNNLGVVYSRQKDWVKAEESYKKALAIDPKSVDAYNGLANVYTAQGKSKEAQETLAEATKLATSGAPAVAETRRRSTMRPHAWNANDFPKANELLTQAVKTDPNHAESHFMLGRVLINLGKLGEAATEFETYLKLAPSGPNAKEAQTNFDALKAYRK